jgi:hypothetical protein
LPTGARGELGYTLRESVKRGKLVERFALSDIADTIKTFIGHRSDVEVARQDSAAARRWR